MLLSVKSIARINVNVATIEAGMATDAMMTARRFLMKNSTTSEASRLPQIRCSSSEVIVA